jgi:hypothetical protein
MKKPIAILATGVIAAALAVGGVATTASAHTNEVSSTCTALSVDLTNYAAIVPEIPAVPAVYNDYDETIVDVPAVDAVDAVTHTEYEFKQWITGHTKWNADRWWNPGLGWYYDGNTRVVVDTPAQDAIPAVTHVVHHHDLVTPGQDAIPAKVNTVVVTVDGATVEDTTFGSSFVKDYTFDNQYVAHDYTVTVRAWDDSQYNVDASGTSTPCDVPVVPAVPAGTVTASCGVADVNLTNIAAEWTVNRTYAANVYIDGKYKETIAVFSGTPASAHYTFAEDSGEHTVTVKLDGETLTSATVQSDCEVNVPTKPEDRVVVSSTDTQDCAAGTVTTVTTTSTYGTTLIDNVWVEDAEPVVTTDTTTRDQTADEKTACPTTVTPVVDKQLPTPDALPFTGANEAGIIAGSLFGGTVLLAGAGALIFSRRVARKTK